jgi:hypothetical protein
VLLYPSVVTLRVHGPRLGLALLPAILLVVGSIRLWGADLFSYWPVVGLFLLTAPFLVLAFELCTAIGGYSASRWGD